MDFPSGNKTEVTEKYIDMVYRICVGKLYDYFPSAVDDACQQVFLNFLNKNPSFKDMEHEKMSIFYLNKQLKPSGENKCNMLLYLLIPFSLRLIHFRV